MIVHGDDSMDDTTGDATDNATVEADEVLNKILDNAIEAHGSSARGVYAAIFSPAFFEKCINDALEGLKYDTLRDPVLSIERAEAGDTFSYSIFTMRETEPRRHAQHRLSRGFEVQFKSHSVKSMVLRHLRVPTSPRHRGYD
jgi:hypothetical protein